MRSINSFGKKQGVSEIRNCTWVPAILSMRWRNSWYLAGVKFWLNCLRSEGIIVRQYEGAIRGCPCSGSGRLLRCRRDRPSDPAGAYRFDREPPDALLRQFGQKDRCRTFSDRHAD